MSIPPIAADTTVLQTVSSYVEPVDGVIAPRAAQAFESIATAFCSGAVLHLPL